MSFTEPTILGRTGLRVSRLGVGAGYGVPAKAVEKAYREYGVNYFYWTSRRAGMQEAIRHLGPTDREKIVVAIQSHDRLGWWLRRSVERGLSRLGLDFADVLVLGFRSRYPMRRVLEMAARLREEKKVRFLAISGHNRRLFGALAQRGDSPIESFQLRYNAAHRGAESEVFPLLPGENRPGIITYTATCWRRLLDPRRVPPGEKPLTAAECYRFVLSNPHVDLCLTGPADERQMDEALRALAQGPLTETEMERVRRIGDWVHGDRNNP